MKFKIKTGRHYHSNIIARIKALTLIHERNEVNVKTMFPLSNWYNKNLVINSGYNKLYGAGAILHQQRSARYVWQPDYDNYGQFRIYSYVYEDGEWGAEYLFNIHAGQWVEIGITKTKEGYLFTWSESQKLIRHSNPTLKKLLQPYFGGQDTAYKDILIHIK